MKSKFAWGLFRNKVAKGIMAIAGILFTSPVYACQEARIVYETSSRSGVLLDEEFQPIRHAFLILRASEPGGGGQEMVCGLRVGPVIARIKADGKGRFQLPRLKEGSYWLTYLDKENGESFNVAILKAGGKNPLELNLFRPGGVCHVVDLERNVTKPVGWCKDKQGPASSAK